MELVKINSTSVALTWRKKTSQVKIKKDGESEKSVYVTRKKKKKLSRKAFNLCYNTLRQIFPSLSGECPGRYPPIRGFNSK